jgi:CcmD family protein
MKTMMRIAVLGLLLAPAPLAAQQAPTGEAVPEAAPGEAPAARVEGAGALEAQPTAQPPAYASQQGTGLAAPGGPPRTLRAFWHVFIAYAITLVLLFGYALSIGARLARVERRLGALGAPEER